MSGPSREWSSNNRPASGAPATLSADCDRLLDFIGAEELPADLARHLAGCVRCREERALYLALDPPAPLELDELKVHSLRKKALAELALQPLPTPWTQQAGALLLLCLFFAGLGALAITGGRLENPLPLGWLYLGSALLLAVLMGGAWLAISPSGARWRPALLLLAVAAAGVVVGGSTGVSGDPRSFIAAGLGCILIELALSTVPVAAALWLLRASAFDPVRALLAGLSGGAAGMLCLQAHCANGERAHLLAFHLLPWAALTLAALVARRRLPTRSHAP